MWGSCGVTSLVFSTLGEEDQVWALRRGWELVFWAEELTLILLQIVLRLSLLTAFGDKNLLVCDVVKHILQPSACKEQRKGTSAMQEQSKEGSRAPKA